MGKDKFSNIFDENNSILIGKIIPDVVNKEDAKMIYSLMENSLKEFPDYKDYILDAGNVSDITIDSFGYLMKALGIVKRTASYMILVLKEEILQKFMLSNPEMFDYYAVFFNNSEAVEYILSKR